MILSRKRKAATSAQSASSPTVTRSVTGNAQRQSKAKFAQPKILLLDVDGASATAISELWSDVQVGTLGRPYKVPQSSSYVPVIQHEELVGHEEADVVVVDLSFPEVAENPTGGRHFPDGEFDLWARCDKGYVDARIRTLAFNMSVFDRILKNGGIFVIFASQKSGNDILMAKGGPYGLSDQKNLEVDIWSLTSETANLSIATDAGEYIEVVDGSVVGGVLEKHLTGARFECGLQAHAYKMEGQWSSLATNKFGHNVGMLGKVGKGFVIVIPQLVQKAAFLVELMTVALPELAPQLFPEIEQSAWVNRPEYELPRVNELHVKKGQIISKAKVELAEIDADIERERRSNGWLQGLLTGTGDSLVDAVKKALAECGFIKVVDVDEIRDQEGKSRREDLRIEDTSPMLIVDIKGIGGYPTDGDATQANKHALINAKELGRADVQGLSIINHQRQLPPLERGNAMPFRQELLDVASETGLGLMTAFDLYRLVVNKRKHQWGHEHLKPVFYRHKRIEPIPAHYCYIGVVAKAMTGKFGVVLSENSIAVGDRISVESEIYFDEAEVHSIQVNGVPVESAAPGDQAGFLWPEGNCKIREGMRVFAVK
ncbi:hypothetical protein [Dyella sp.]|uniref:hypothetical protein n=1 Tax=Dyella sp. TaxID=1869338 RepID=UPI003F7EE2A7